MATYGSGFAQGGNALIAPSYRKYIYRKTISLDTNEPQTFPRVVGPQRIVMSWAQPPGPPKTWSFAITGGSNSVESSVLPMFPRPSGDVYNQVINYRVNGQDIPSFGCIVLGLPIPPASESTSRINRFQVVETVIVLGLAFLFAWCPFSEVDPTVTYLGDPLDPNVVEMKIISYRATAANNRVNTLPVSRGAPFYFVRKFPTIFNSVAGVNPLDALTALPFQRVSGQQTIVVSLSSGFYFLFDVDYGIISQGGGYLGYTYNPTPNAVLATKDVENATILSIDSPNNINAQQRDIYFTVAATDGRTYIFIFDPSGNNQVPPTIQLSAGPPLAAEDLVVNVLVRYFEVI